MNTEARLWGKARQLSNGQRERSRRNRHTKRPNTAGISRSPEDPDFETFILRKEQKETLCWRDIAWQT